MRMVKNPFLAIPLAVSLGIAYSWIGIFIAAQTNLPVSFFIATLSFGTYFIVRLTESLSQQTQNKNYA